MGWLKNGILFLGLVIAAVAMFGWLVFSADVLWNDYPVYQVRYAQAYRFYLALGIEPLWYPHIELGMPAGGLVMAQAFHPPAWILAQIPGFWDGSILKLISLKHILLCVVSQGAFYFGLRRFGGISCGVAFTLSFLFVYQLRTLDAIRYGTFNDALCYFLVAAIAGIHFLRQGSRLALGLVCAATQLMISCGYQPILSYGLFAFVILTPLMYRSFFMHTRWLSRLPATLAAAAVGFLLAAPHWLPFVDFLNVNAQRVDQTSVTWANEYALVTDRPFPMNLIGYLANLTMPAVTEAHSGFGGSVLYSWLILSIFAYLLITVRKNYLALAIFLVPFVYIAGIKGGIFPVFYNYFPTIKLSRIPGRMGVVIAVTLFTAAIFAVLQIRADSSNRKRVIIAMRVSSVLLILLNALSAYIILTTQSPLESLSPGYTLSSLNPRSWTGEIQVLWILVSVAAAAGLYVLSDDVYARLTGAPTESPVIAATLWSTVLIIALLQSAYLMRHGSWTRVRGGDPTFDEFRNADHLPLMTGYPFIAESVVGHGYGAAAIPAANFYQLAGRAKVLECLYPIREQNQEIEKNHLPFYVSNQVSCAENWEDGFASLDPKSCAPLGTVVALTGSSVCRLPDDPKRTGVRELERLNRRTKLMELTPNAVSFRTVTGSNSLLVTPLPFIPGWSASIDGGPANLVEINGGLIAVALRPGKHLVRFSYYSSKKCIGYLVALGTALALACTSIILFAPLRSKIRIIFCATLLVLGSASIWWWHGAYIARVNRPLLLNNSYDKLLDLQLKRWREASVSETIS